MPATYWTQWCHYCGGYRNAWTNDHRRCYSCDRWTMSCHHGCHGCCDHGTSEALRRAEDRNSSLISQNSSLQGQLSSKDTQVAEKDKQIALVTNNLTNTQKELEKKENQLVERDKRLETLGDLFTNLKIESSGKDKEIEIKNKDVKDLKMELVESQGEVFNYKFKEQERKLNEFIQQLGIGREKPRELRRAYQQLIRAREDYNRDKIDEAEDKIEDIKDELLSSGWIQKGMSVENVQKLCSKCEKLAELKIEQGKIQEQKWNQQRQLTQIRQEQEQQYEARQEVPPRK